MRLKLTLIPESESGGSIPINYNTFVSEFVYSLLDPDKPFAYEDSESARSIPYYTFSNLYIPNVTQQGRSLEFAYTAIELTVSLLVDARASSEVLARANRITHLDFHPRSETALRVQKIEVIQDSRKFTRRARFRMLSPLASPLWEPIEGEASEPYYIHYSEPDFSESIRQILLAKYKRWKGELPTDTELHFALDQKYLQRRRGRISKLVTFNEGEPNERSIKAVVAPFEVEGNPELIWLGYVAGFGERNLLGFGCADVVAVGKRDLHMPEDRGHLPVREQLSLATGGVPRSLTEAPAHEVHAEPVESE
jgi:CRISPR-associated endoribonuclease Cas6